MPGGFPSKRGCQEVFQPSTSHLTHLTANMHERGISLPVTALLCCLHNRETLSSAARLSPCCPSCAGEVVGGWWRRRSSLFSFHTPVLRELGVFFASQQTHLVGRGAEFQSRSSRPPPTMIPHPWVPQI